jgi:hypothetical protein
MEMRRVPEVRAVSDTPARIREEAKIGFKMRLIPPMLWLVHVDGGKGEYIVSIRVWSVEPQSWGSRSGDQG